MWHIQVMKKTYNKEYPARHSNEKLYGQAKAKRIQQHQTSFVANTKEISLDGKELATIEMIKLQMGKLTSKDKHTVKAGNHPRTDISKPAIVSRVQMKDMRNAFEIKKPAN